MVLLQTLCSIEASGARTCIAVVLKISNIPLPQEHVHSAFPRLIFCLCWL